MRIDNESGLTAEFFQEAKRNYEKNLHEKVGRDMAIRRAEIMKELDSKSVTPPAVKAGRKEPYTGIGIRRMKCARCGDQAMFQWQICSDGNTFRPICLPCDIELNELVLNWMGDPDAKSKIEAYRREKESQCK